MYTLMHFTQYSITTKIWLYPGKGGWHFATIDKETSADISKHFHFIKQGWGSLKVSATIGNTVWKTSIFPDRKTSTYVLPIKGDVRKKERIANNDTVTIQFQIIS